LGCVAHRIAAHAADVARGLPAIRERDDAMARARAALDWPRQFELAFDGQTARTLRDTALPEEADYCGMCGRDWCAMRITRDLEQDRTESSVAHPAPRGE